MATSRKLKVVDSDAQTIPTPLPKELVDRLPTAKLVVSHLAAVEGLLPALEQELEAAKSRGAIALAGGFVVLHRMMEFLKARVKAYEALFERYKTLDCPQTFERDQITHVPLTAGYRVTISYTTRARVLPDKRDDAYQWLRDNYPDVVIETVNASTLSALARQMADEKNEQLPSEMFQTVELPGTSVTRT